jgi:hypothetical protein
METVGNQFQAVIPLIPPISLIPLIPVIGRHNM